MNNREAGARTDDWSAGDPQPGARVAGTADTPQALASERAARASAVLQTRRVERFLAGDDELVSQMRVALARASWRFRTRLRLPWEDLQQELLLELTAALQRGLFRGEARLETYAWRLAQCACIDRLRAERAARTTQDVPLEELGERRAPGRSALQRVLDEEALRALARLVARMPSECRRLWGLIAAGFSYDQMSAATGVASGTLRVRVLRCRRKARELADRTAGQARG